MIAAGQLPVKRLGLRICASKAKLRQFFEVNEDA
jgi:hypothetical protein